MRAVFHLLSDDEDEQRRALTIAQNLLADDSVEMDAVAVVAQAGGIGPLLEGDDGNEDVESLLESDVSINACSNTLETADRGESDLL